VCAISCKRNNNAEGLFLPVYLKIEMPDFSDLQPLRLSEFADSIAYIQLETTDECLTSYDRIAMMYHVDSFLIIREIYSSLLQFNAVSGKFLHQIGKRGQGAGEYSMVQSLCVDKDDKKIIVQDGNSKLMIFDYEGNYHGNLQLDDTTNTWITTCFHSLGLSYIDRQYMIFNAAIMPASAACQPNELIVYDYINRHVPHTLPNRMEGTYGRSSMNGMRICEKQDDKLFFKSFYNDTLYIVHKEEGIKPYAIIDLGMRELPVSGLLSNTDPSRIARDVTNKILLNNAYINHNCIFLECHVINDTKLKDVDGFICRYDFATEKITYHPSIIINDIDGGPNFVGSLSFLSRKLLPVIPFDEVEESNKKFVFSTLDKSELKYPELKDKFNTMQKNKFWEDNPVIMILRNKNPI
jgi:hypothetical protein